MVSNEQLMNESLKGNKNSLKLLKYYAGSGDCEAQYYLAMYYAKSCGHLHDPVYWYWLEKSKENGYVPGVGKPIYEYYNYSLFGGLTWNDICACSHIADLLCILL